MSLPRPVRSGRGGGCEPHLLVRRCQRTVMAANLDGTNPHSLISGLNFGFNGVAVGPQ
jgi:hypothetical protein